VREDSSGDDSKDLTGSWAKDPEEFNSMAKRSLRREDRRRCLAGLRMHLGAAFVLDKSLPPPQEPAVPIPHRADSIGKATKHTGRTVEP
jgi:hypothetical protein